MDRIEFEPMRLLGPGFADDLEGGETSERLEPAGEVVGGQEVSKVQA